MPAALAIRDAIYTPEFRHFVEEVTGCGALSDKTDCSVNMYSEGCHLLCHDDVIGTRRASYIIYLTPPEVLPRTPTPNPAHLEILNPTASRP